MNDLVTAANAASSLSTAFKNVYDIAGSMLSTRKQNKLVAAWQYEKLKTAVCVASQRAKMAGLHDLMKEGRNNLIDSFNQIKDFKGTEIESILLETVKEEAYYYKLYFDRYVEAGGLQCFGSFC